MIKKMIETNKKTVGNYAGMKWTLQQITKFGMDGIGKKSFCNPCYEANHSKIPIGEKTSLYSHLWNSLEKRCYTISGKTLTEYYKCSQCGHEVHEVTTYKNGNKRMIHLDDVKNLIMKSAKDAWRNVWKFRGEYNEFTQGHYVGELGAYKHALDLLNGH